MNPLLQLLATISTYLSPGQLEQLCSCTDEDLQLYVTLSKKLPTEKLVEIMLRSLPPRINTKDTTPFAVPVSATPSVAATADDISMKPGTSASCQRSPSPTSQVSAFDTPQLLAQLGSTPKSTKSAAKRKHPRTNNAWEHPERDGDYVPSQKTRVPCPNVGCKKAYANQANFEAHAAECTKPKPQNKKQTSKSHATATTTAKPATVPVVPIALNPATLKLLHTTTRFFRSLETNEVNAALDCLDYVDRIVLSIGDSELRRRSTAPTTNHPGQHQFTHIPSIVQFTAQLQPASKAREQHRRTVSHVRRSSVVNIRVQAKHLTVP